MDQLDVREYGTGTATIVAIHGGPAAAGDLAPLARRLGERWRVLEPYQRGRGGRPLTVAVHVQDLDDLIRARCSQGTPVLVGHSWGAMLALALAAEHPTLARAVVLVGCGTFSPAARSEFEARWAARMTPEIREALSQIDATETHPDRRLAAHGRIATRVYGYDLDAPADGPPFVDAVAHRETWADMVRLQREGVYPSAFASVACPVLMLHGETDPHPGPQTRDDLRGHIPHLEYREFARCGHSPWLERQARDEFFAVLHGWVAARWPTVPR
jgi:pimeloyl-ACP methyl ester carboxylesterase